MKRFVLVVWLTGMAAMLSGCMVGADFDPPSAPQATDYTRTPVPEQTTPVPSEFGEVQRLVAGAVVEADWWRQFGSSKLDELVVQALQANPDLDAAEAVLRQALHTYESRAGSSLFPQVDAGLGGQRQQINRAAFGQAEESKVFNLFHASVGVSYNLDFSGGIRRGLEALAAQADHQSYRLAGARLAIVGNVVTTAIAQAQIHERIRIVEDILALQAEQLKITRERFELGVISKQEVFALRTQLEQTRATLPPLRRQLEQTNDLMAVLLGQTPAEAKIPRFTLSDFQLPTELPLNLPSELVRRRPDILASEALLQASVAHHGVSVSKLYPRISLSADMGSQALTLGGLFGEGSLIWGLAGNLTQPLFNKGLRAEIRVAEAEVDAAAANYRQTLLHAFAEVADVLRALDSNAQALSAQSAAYQSAMSSLALVELQYKLGVVSYLEVLVAQKQLQETSEALSSAQAQRLLDTAALYQVMGGEFGSASEAFSINHCCRSTYESSR